MGLAKIRITPLDGNETPVYTKSFEVQFNPSTYAISKSVVWNGAPVDAYNAPYLKFGGGGSRQLTMDLFYDVTEPVNGRHILDVREETNKLVALSRIHRTLERPPVVKIAWGTGEPTNSDFPFIGVISQLTQTFKLFSHDGRPLRADVSVTFTEFLSPEKDQHLTDPDFTTRRVRRGDTLSAIAADAYGDPARWRIIAEANNLDDPRQLEIGLRLAIPKLT
jgi:LysM repeat protein